MDEEHIYKKARAMGYQWSQTEKGRKRLDGLMEIHRQRFVIMDGIQEGIELAEWERNNSNKNKAMEDEKIDPNYRKGYNLGYWLNRSQDGEQHYKDLLDVQKSSKFKETTMYKGLEAGREQAEKDRELDQSLEKSDKMEKGKMPLLNEKQKKEAQEYLDTYDQKEKGIQDKIKHQKDHNNKMEEAEGNSKFVEDEAAKKKREEDEFVKQFVNKGIERDNGRER